MIIIVWMIKINGDCVDENEKQQQQQQQQQKLLENYDNLP